MTKPQGILIQHRAHKTSILVLIPVLSIPIPNARPCRVCQVPHLCKTVHLSLSPTGSAIVSQGVLDLLKKAGMGGFDVVGSTNSPPPIYVGPNAKPRVEQDHQTYAQQIWRNHGPRGTTGGTPAAARRRRIAPSPV